MSLVLIVVQTVHFTACLYVSAADCGANSAVLSHTILHLLLRNSVIWVGLHCLLKILPLVLSFKYFRM